MRSTPFRAAFSAMAVAAVLFNSIPLAVVMVALTLLYIAEGS